MSVFVMLVIHGLENLAREIVKELSLKMEPVSVQKVLDGTILLNSVYS